MKLFFYPIIVILILCSCHTPKRTYSYFKDVPDTVSLYNIIDTGFKALTIKTDDLLQINISSPNPEANSFFITPGSNVSNGTSNSAAGTATPNTYLVDKDGGIDMPLIGRVIVRGLTMNEARNDISGKLLTFLKDPIVTVRLQNFKVTILGEVTRPANYYVSNERVSVLDALGMAGDMTIYGRRENVLLIREKDGKKSLTRLNLNTSALFRSPYYYLQQNDIVYVEASKEKVVANDRTTLRSITLVTAVISLFTVILTRVL